MVATVKNRKPPKPKPERKPKPSKPPAKKHAASAPAQTPAEIIPATSTEVRSGLDRMNGELIEDLGRGWINVPIAKWADTWFWAEACAQAETAFRKAGCQITVTFDEQSVLVQEYPLAKKVAFIFHRRVPVFQWQQQKKGFKNRDLYHVVVLGHDPQLDVGAVVQRGASPGRGYIWLNSSNWNQLVMSGRWKGERRAQ